jgi:thioredoxin reductase
MRRKNLILFSLLCLYFPLIAEVSTISTNSDKLNNYFKWAVIGAGPAGIAAVTVLLETGLAPQDILWIDPVFNVGHLSAYPEVPANTSALDFINYFQSSKYFKVAHKYCNKLLEHGCEPHLKDVIVPLQSITHCLKSLVISQLGYVTNLTKKDDYWHIIVNGQKINKTEQVILATGSYPAKLNYDSAKNIPVEIALNKDSLAGLVNLTDTVVVFGGSHSAVLVLKFLTEIGVKNIINVYKNDLVFCDFSYDPPLHQGSGLKGLAARWAKKNLVNEAKLVKRIKLEDFDEKLLESVDKIIYAIGYKPNLIDGIDVIDFQAGQLASGLFGMGIAFPEVFVDQFGNRENLIGLDSFMDYARKLIPNLVNKRSFLNRDLDYFKIMQISF